MSWSGRTLLALAPFLVTGCLFYDSRWGESTAEQKHAAARLAPASVEARPASGDITHRRATVRACATQAYVAETVDWEQRFDELLRTASSVLEPALGLTLENAGTQAWQPPHGEGDLSTIISDLPSCEGPDADWVLALVQSTPRVVSDFHVLGKGQMYSRYLVMRAPNDPAEFEGLARALPDLDQETREGLYSERKRHKLLTVFLHELSHTLGAVHRVAKDTIMSPSYDASERGYDEATVSLMRIGLRIRLEKANGYAEVQKYLESNSDGFVASEREGQIAMLTEWAKSIQPEPPAATPAASTTVQILAARPRVEPLPFETLSKEERRSFDEALRAERRSARDAWALAEPLFEAHPAVREVQELRCRLANERRFFQSVIEAHCARLAALEPEGPGAQTR